MSLVLEPIDLNKNYSVELYASHECKAIISTYKTYYPESGFSPPWIGYFLIRDNTVVGCCGFTGRPVNGRVEIAYFTFKEFEGQGLASYSCAQLIQITKNADTLLIINAKTAPEKNASTKILEKNGFIFSEIVQDHEIGDAWEWVLKW